MRSGRHNKCGVLSGWVTPHGRWLQRHWSAFLERDVVVTWVEVDMLR